MHFYRATLATVLSLASLISSANQNPFAAMESARDRKDYVSMERICRAQVSNGFRTEYMVRSWSWALARLDRSEEAIQVARQNVTWNPCGWSWANLAEVLCDAGEFAKSRSALIEVPRYRRAGEDTRGVENHLLSRLQRKTYEITWNFPVLDSTRDRVRKIVIPQQEGRVQSDVTLNIQGIENPIRKVSGDGIAYLEVTQKRGERLHMSGTVTMSPFSWRPLLKNFDPSASLPAEAMLCLGRSVEGQFVGVDPATPEIQAHAKLLKGANDLETIQRTIQWIETEIPWTDIPGRLNSTDCFKLRKGSCTPRTLVAIALLRANGIAARAWRGYSGVDGMRRNPSPHTIPQFFVRGVGWVDTDFGLRSWEAPTAYLRMYHRAGSDYGFLGDGIDPAKEVTVRLLSAK